MIWTAIRNNKISFLLITTVVIGLCYDFLNISNSEVISWHKYPATEYWFGWFVMDYLNEIILLICILLNKSNIDKIVLYSYLIWNAYSAYSYIIYGWPEPKNFIILGFGLIVLFLVGRKIYYER